MTEGGTHGEASTSTRAPTIIPPLIPDTQVKSYTIDDTKADKHFSLKLGDIKQLTGQDNYNTWMFIMTRMLKSMEYIAPGQSSLRKRQPRSYLAT